MNSNYISYSLMIICGLLAVNIYRLRISNLEKSNSLTEANEQVTRSQEKKVECETSLKSQQEALKEVQDALNAKIAENDQVQKNLDSCLQDLEKKKQEAAQQEEARKAEE